MKDNVFILILRCVLLLLVKSYLGNLASLKYTREVAETIADAEGYLKKVKEAEAKG